MSRWPEGRVKPGMPKRSSAKLGRGNLWGHFWGHLRFQKAERPIQCGLAGMICKTSTQY